MSAGTVMVVPPDEFAPAARLGTTRVPTMRNPLSYGCPESDKTYLVVEASAGRLTPTLLVVSVTLKLLPAVIDVGRLLRLETSRSGKVDPTANVAPGDAPPPGAGL